MLAEFMSFRQGIHLLSSSLPRNASGVISAALILLAPALGAQIEVLPDVQPQRVFSGESRKLRVILRNPSDQNAEASLSRRVSQTSSATAVLVEHSPWKRVQLLPGQTVIESAAVTFPPVKAETRFVVQWVRDLTNVLGRTEVLAYPRGLLRELKVLSGDAPIGIFDPLAQLKPAFKQADVPFDDLQDLGVDSFSGKLAILGPFQSRTDIPEDFKTRVQDLAAKGTGVVWLEPPRNPREPLKPSFYLVRSGKGTVVVTENKLVSELDQNPEAQLNLLELCRLAMRAEAPGLPDFSRTK